jgi:hypothetical protein
MKEKTIECIRKFTEDRDRDQFHSPVVRAFGDYGNTTNEGMQMSRCRSADLNCKGYRYIVCNR